MTRDEQESFESGIALGVVITAVAATIVALLTGSPVVVLSLVSIASAVGTLWYSYDRFGGVPFTNRYRMGVVYARERDRRAAEFVKLGIAPDIAIARAVKDMAKEAEDVLKEEGKS